MELGSLEKLEEEVEKVLICGKREEDSQFYCSWLPQAIHFVIFCLFFKDSDTGWNCEEWKAVAESLLSTNVLLSCVRASFIYNLRGVS